MSCRFVSIFSHLTSSRIKSDGTVIDSRRFLDVKLAIIASITAPTTSLSSYPGYCTFFYLMYEANIVQGTLLTCLTNLSYLLHLFSPLWRFVSDFGSSVLLSFSACCSLCLILFCIFSLFIASTISRSNFFFPLFFPDLLKFLHPV